MTAPGGRWTFAAGLAFTVTAAYVVLGELHRGAPFPALDVYIYFIPNKLHAVYAVWHGGKGLLWNPYQACGEPFLVTAGEAAFFESRRLSAPVRCPSCRAERRDRERVARGRRSPVNDSTTDEATR